MRTSTRKHKVLDLMLKNTKVHPRLAFEHSGMFADPDLAYALSEEYAEEQQKKLQEQQEAIGNESGNDTEGSGTDSGDSETREQSGGSNRTRKDHSGGNQTKAPLS